MIKITPQEFMFQENRNPVQVQTCVSKELLDDDKMFLPHVKHFNLSAGTVILVQVMNDAKDKLLHEAEFRVISAVQSSHGVVDDYGSKVVAKTAYQVQRWSDWKSSELVEEDAPVIPEEEDERYVPGEAELKRGPGGIWQVIVDEQVWTTVKRRKNEDKDEYYARALEIAAGGRKVEAA